MTATRVRRRSEPVEAVQWHPTDAPHEAVFTDRFGEEGQLQTRGMWLNVKPGDWIIAIGCAGYRVLTPEQFAEEYERVDAALGRDV